MAWLSDAAVVSSVSGWVLVVEARVSSGFKEGLRRHVGQVHVSTDAVDISMAVESPGVSSEGCCACKQNSW